VPRLVIQRNAMSYDAAVLGDFTAEALAPDPAAWTAFTRMLQRKGKARIAVASTVRSGDAIAGRFEGEFVAIA
jgi:thioesterase domain-containing protein